MSDVSIPAPAEVAEIDDKIAQLEAERRGLQLRWFLLRCAIVVPAVIGGAMNGRRSSVSCAGSGSHVS